MRFEAPAPSPAAEGDPVYVGDSFAKTWSDSTPNVRELAGSIQGGVAVFNYSRLVVPGVRYHLKAWQRASNRWYYPLMGLKAIGSSQTAKPLTAIAWDKWGWAYEFEVGSDGSIITLRDDTPQLRTLSLQYIGIAPPGLEYLSENLAPNDTISVYSTWGGTDQALPGTWTGADWRQSVTTMADSTMMLRWEGGGKERVAGCYAVLGTTVHECKYLVDIDPTETVYRFFQIVAHSDGTISDGGPDNRWPEVRLGSPRRSPGRNEGRKSE